VTALHGSKPVVLIAGDPRPDLDTVAAENTHSASELTAHVLAHGRRRLVFVGDPASGPDIRDRYAGFVAAHESAGLRPAEPVRVPLRESSGTAVADRLLSGDLEADGLVCANDELALAAMLRLQEGGRHLPADVAVVGWDDVMTARYMQPGLTTVRQPVRELGVLAAERLHARIGGTADAPQAQLIPTQLVLRGSCGCATARIPAP
jgi:LacI family transcriptional regulator